MTQKEVNIMGVTVPIGTVAITIITLVGAIYYLNGDISSQITNCKNELQRDLQEIKNTNQVDINKMNLKLDSLSEKFGIMAIDVDRIKKDNAQHLEKIEFEKWIMKVNKEKKLDLPDVE